jgi:NAD+ synthase (glutamine-hydrolysing)
VKLVYHKRELPNYGVFDEKRYFTPGNNPGIVTIKGVKVGINICEDIWIDGAVYKSQVKSGAKVLINMSSSPYEVGKLKTRQVLLCKRAKEVKRPIVYVNCAGVHETWMSKSQRP